MDDDTKFGNGKYSRNIGWKLMNECQNYCCDIRGKFNNVIPSSSVNDGINCVRNLNTFILCFNMGISSQKFLI